VIVDAHQHFWDPATTDYPWMTDEHRRRYGPDDLAPLLDEHGVCGTIVVQARHSFDETRELLALAGHPDASDEARIQAVCRRYVALLSGELAKPTQSTKLMVGIVELLDALADAERDGRALVGLLTGNLAAGAALQLRSAGLDPARFRVGAFGSDSHRRSDLPLVAATRAAALTGDTFAGQDVVVVGDTPEDVACGRQVGARALAVATGFYDAAALRAAGAPYVFETLADTAAVLDAIFA